jgi:predicted Ser/Thr protein kinase
MQFQRCPNCRERNDVSVYVHGQLARCNRCGIRYAVDREAVASSPDQLKTPAPSARGSGRITPSRESPTEVSGPGPASGPAAGTSAEQQPAGGHPTPAGRQVITSGQILPDSGPQAKPAPPPPPPPEAGVAPPKPEIPGYDMLELLGRGGMGEVWRARQQSLNRIVAVKVLSPTLAVEPDFVRRFERESSALATIAHPNVVTVFDRGSANGHWYFVMEFVEGRSLRERVEAHPPRNDLIRLVLQVLRAVDHAHRKGVIHRDLKPENVLIDSAGDAKVADFGLAGMSEVGRSSLTMTAVAMGTAHYMAPEQRRDAKNVDGRADLYSLGVILYELFCQELPTGKFPTPREKVPDLDPRLDAIIMRMLEQDPEKRPARASEVVDVLEAILSGPPPKTALAAAGPQSPARPIESMISRVRQHPGQRAALVAALCLLVIVLGVAMSRVGASESRQLAAAVQRIPGGRAATVEFGTGAADGIAAGADGWATHDKALVRSAETAATGADDPHAWVQKLALDFDNAAMEADVEIDGKGTAEAPAIAELALDHDDRQVAVRIALAGDATPSLVYASPTHPKATKVDGAHEHAADDRKYHLELWVVNGRATALLDKKTVASASVGPLAGIRAKPGFGCQVGRCRFSNVRVSGVLPEDAVASAAPRE